ncbi:MAG: ATP-binding protein [Patescibacteria group bacterium]
MGVLFVHTKDETMLYAKKIEEITFDDVVTFCDEQHRENMHLDYKRELNANIAKTIAAMANTLGGLIIVGVDEDDSKPKLPIEGIDYKEHLVEQVNNLILGNITPPIFPEVQICANSKKEKAFIVIRVPQSALTPHAVRGNTKVYIRTNTSNEPEEIATLDRVSWLTNKRDRSIKLRDSFYERADDRFGVLCEKDGVEPLVADTSFSISPLYPFEALVDYISLKKDIPSKISVHGWGGTFPRCLVRLSELETTQYGAYGFIANKNYGFILYEELNHFGFFYHRVNLAHREKEGEEGKLVQVALLWDILMTLDKLLASALKLYTEMGYWGLLELRVSMNELVGAQFNDLPAPSGYYKLDHISHTPIDNSLEFKRTISLNELREGRKTLVSELLKDISWAIGFSNIRQETIELLIDQNSNM